MKNRKFIAPLLFLAVIAGFTACEDNRNEYLEDYQTIVYFRNGGEQEVSLYRVGEDTYYEIPICKTGRNLEGTASATVVSMSQIQLDIYNLESGYSYNQLPGDCWRFVEMDDENTAVSEPIHLEFGSDDSYQVIKAHLRINEISTLQQANPDKEYVLALQVYAEPKIGDDVNIIIIKPEIAIPQLYFNTTSLVANYFTKADADKSEYSNYVVLGLENRWNFTVDIASDNQDWLDEYNAKNNSSYVMLPDDAYSFGTQLEPEENGTVTFTPESDRVPVSIVVDKSDLVVLNEYILPLTISSWSKKEFEADERANHWLLSFRVNPDEVKLRTDMLSSPYTHTSDGAGLSALVSDPSSNWWHSNYSGSTDNLDTKYGHYIDIALDSPLSAIVFEYQTRTNNGNGVPTLIVIGGTNDPNAVGVASQSANDAWTELMSIEDGLATSANEWCTLPSIQSATAYKYLRFGIAVSKLGDLRTKNSGTALSELKLYGENTVGTAN